MRRLGWLSLYAVAMGWLEAVVVVYLRELYYPDGFGFPIVIIPDRLAMTELLRELTTLLMILAVAMLAGKDRTDRFFVFALVFGLWDIVYYLGLWLLLDWPESLFTWDVLFLIPVPWLAPVIYPLIIAVLLIVGFFVHDARRVQGRPLRLTVAEWTVASVGAIVVVVAFCWNWRVVAAQTAPEGFPVWIFLAGTLLGLAPFGRATLRGIRGQLPNSEEDQPRLKYNRN